MNELIYNIISGIIAAVVAVLYTLFNNWRLNKKIKNAQDETEKEKNKTEALEVLKSTINMFIATAEEMKDYKGFEKLQFVVTRALRAAYLAHVEISEEDIVQYVEEQIDLTNKVNCYKLIANEEEKGDETQNG